MIRAREIAAESAHFIRGPAWWAIDDVDFQLVAVMRRRPLGSHEEWGRAIERTASTVRKRLAGLKAQGVLQGFNARPLPEILGLRGIWAQWDRPVDANALYAVDGTFVAGVAIDGRTLAGAYADDTHAWLAAATRLAGRPPTMTVHDAAYRGPVMGPLDLRVMAALVQAPRGSAEELSDLSGLSAKTVRKRHDAIVAAGAMVFEPVFRLARSGAIAYHVHVACKPREAGPVLAALGETYSGSPECPFLCTHALAASLEEQAQQLAAVRALGHHAEVVQEHEFLLRKEALFRMIEQASRRWKRATGG